MYIWCLFTTHVSLFILGNIPAACSESWYWKLELCVTSFWFYYDRLWWSSWHAMLAFFLLYVFLAWIFSWSDLFQVTVTEGSCVLYIICYQFITFEQVTLCLPTAPGLLHCWHHLMPFCLILALICFCLNLIVQFTLEFEFELHWSVSTEDSDHVIS